MSESSSLLVATLRAFEDFEGFEVSSGDSAAVHRLLGPLADDKDVGKWCVHWEDAHGYHEEVFDEPDTAVARFLAVRAFLAEKETPP